MSTGGPIRPSSKPTQLPTAAPESNSQPVAEGSTGKRKVSPSEEVTPKLSLAGRRKRLGLKSLALTATGSRSISKQPSSALNESKVPESIVNMWGRLESNKPEPSMFSEVNVKTAYEFLSNKIVADTSVSLSGSEQKLTPYNWVTLGGQKIGIAARGPVSHEGEDQRGVFLRTVVEKECNAIVNLATPLEGLSDYIPKQSQSMEFDNASIETIEKLVPKSLEEQSKVIIKSEGKSKKIDYFLKGDIANRAAADPKQLIALAKKMPAFPIMVHCKHGIGRTAMFMLTLALVRDSDLTKENLVKTVFDMIQQGRECRGYFLERQEQLETVLKVGAELLGMENEELQQRVSQYLT